MPKKIARSNGLIKVGAPPHKRNKSVSASSKRRQVANMYQFEAASIDAWLADHDVANGLYAFVKTTTNHYVIKSVTYHGDSCLLNSGHKFMVSATRIQDPLELAGEGFIINQRMICWTPKTGSYYEELQLNNQAHLRTLRFSGQYYECSQWEKVINFTSFLQYFSPQGLLETEEACSRLLVALNLSAVPEMVMGLPPLLSEKNPQSPIEPMSAMTPSTVVELTVLPDAPQFQRLMVESFGTPSARYYSRYPHFYARKSSKIQPVNIEVTEVTQVTINNSCCTIQ